VIIEQAIYTSARTARLTGYQLVAVSPGVSEADARELASWGPSHDSLLESGSAAISVNFMRLPSGAWCVSQSTPEGPELSGRGGARVYTQALIVQRNAFTRFACNPFALWRAALAQGVIDVESQPPERLGPIELLGQAAVIDEKLLGQLAHEPGTSWLAALIDAVLSEPTVGVAAGRNGPRLVAGLMNCLPPCLRGNISFSTGLRYSSSRPFGVAVVSENPSEQRRLQRQFQMRIVAVGDAPPPIPEPTESWGGFMSWVLTTGRLSWLAAHFRDLEADVSLEGLTHLGARWHASAADRVSSSERRTVGPTLASGPPNLTTTVAVEIDRRSNRRQRADASHRTAETRDLAVADCKDYFSSDPAAEMAARFPLAAVELHALQDALFEALAGKEDRLADLARLYRDAMRLVGPAATDQLRERFLRFTVETWRELGEDHPAARHRRAAPAMEILELLTMGSDGLE
jgi:hypothetical protein